MTFAEKMAELHQAVRDLRTALAFVIAPWLQPRWLRLRHEAGDCDCARPGDCLFEAGFTAARAERAESTSGPGWPD